MRHALFSLVLIPFFTIAYAQTTTQATTTKATSTAKATTTLATEAEIQAAIASSTKSKAPVALASVNITSGTIATSTNQVSFIVTNNGLAQEGARYRLVLTNAEGAVVYVQTFDRSLTLPKDTPVPVSEKAIIPTGLKGTYELEAQVLTSEGLPLATTVLETLKLSDKANVSLSSCVSGKQTYKQNEAPSITCSTNGTLGKETSLGVRLFLGNQPKEIASTSTGNVKAKTSISLSPLSEPGNYIGRVSLYQNGVPSGEEKSVLFTVDGIRASLLSASLDQNFYKLGDVAQVTFSFNIFMSGASTTLFATTDIVGKNGPCVSGTKDALTQSQAMSISVPVTRECIDPTLTVQIVDDSGVVYDKKMVSLTSPAITKTVTPIEKPSHKPVMYALGGGTLLLAFLGAAWLAVLRHKKSALLAAAPIAATVAGSAPATSSPETTPAKPEEKIEQKSEQPAETKQETKVPEQAQVSASEPSASAVPTNHGPEATPTV